MSCNALAFDRPPSRVVVTLVPGNDWDLPGARIIKDLEQLGILACTLYHTARGRRATDMNLACVAIDARVVYDPVCEAVRLSSCEALPEDEEMFTKYIIKVGSEELSSRTQLP